jgi:hypothetical protein
MIAAVMVLILGIVSIWLGHRAFTSIYRITTIVWGTFLSLLFIYAATAALNPNDVGGSIFFISVSLVVIPIPVLAAMRRSFPASLSIAGRGGGAS